MLSSVFMRFYSITNYVKGKIESKLIECDAWYIVLLAVLMTLALTLVSALAVWCLVYKDKKFTGEWKWSKLGVSVKAECK